MTTSLKPHWYVYRTQHAHYTARGLPFASSYEEWEPAHLQRRARGIRIIPQERWELVSWPLDEDERRYNALMGGITFAAPAWEQEAAA